MRLLAVLLFAGGIGVALPLALLLPGQGGAPSLSPAVVPARDPRVDALAASVQELQRRVAALEAQLAAPRAAVPPAPDDGPAREQVAALERRLAALERPRAARPAMPQDVAAAAHGGVAQPPETKEDAARREAAQRTILDPKASVKDKLAAHEQLRRVPDAYTPAMVQELLRIAAATDDGQERADVWRCFDGSSKLPALVQPLLRALASDPADIAREEAAETLGNYLDDPVVESALQWSAARDGAERVRAKAQRTLQSGPAR
jgi:outer membrane murein-binding lipoprotein Lpp